MSETRKIDIEQIPAQGVEVRDEELASLVGGMRSNVSATMGGLDGDGYSDVDGGFC